MKPIQKIALVGTLVGALLAIPEYAHGAEKPLRYLQNLVVNTNPSHRTSVNKSEEAGQKDLEKIVDSSFFEEIWAFLPQRKQWVEIGHRETLVSTSDGIRTSLVYFDYPYLLDLMRKNSAMTVWHPHPIGVVLHSNLSNSAQAVQTGYSLQVFTEDFSYKDSDENRLVLSALPSAYDLVAAVRISRDFCKYQRQGEITFKIASRHGVTEYSLTSQGLAHFNDKDNGYIEDWSSRLKQVSRRLLPRLECEAPNTKLILLINQMRNSYLEMQFVPKEPTALTGARQQ